MDPVQKALWYVESHSRESISLEDIADACKVSPFHLTRAFAATMGLSLMRYVRARRLSEAARQLASGARHPQYRPGFGILIARSVYSCFSRPLWRDSRASSRSGAPSKP